MKWKKIVVVAIALILLPIVFGNESKNKAEINFVERTDAMPVIVSKENPFYAIIATPVSLYYDNGIHVQPLLVENISNPSKAITRFKEMYGLKNAITIANKNIEEASIEIATEIWNRTDEAMIVENSYDGYKMAVAIASLASYEDMPIFITDDTNNIAGILQNLGVKKTYIVGNINGYGSYVRFTDIKQINDFMIDYVKNHFNNVDYITITNPSDVKKARVIESKNYNFNGFVNSGSTLHGLHILLTGMNYSIRHEIEIPPSYKHARIKIDLINLDSKYVEKWGDRMFMHLTTPDNITFIYTSTAAGIPVVKNGSIISDRLHFETAVYNKPGKYKVDIMGTWIMKNKGKYAMHAKVEKIDDTSYSLMHNLSSMAPYLTAYHHGIVFANESFAFAGNESIGVKGVVYPSTNEELVKPCDEHLFKVHEKLNQILSRIANISSDDVEGLHNYYTKNPIYIAIMADPTMVPMFYYHNPDSDNIIGVQLPSDFFYGDIDPNKNDWENDSFTYYPTMENAVGRVTGYDAEDCSALIARTVAYNEIIDSLGDWKNNATVQTGSGLEFQWIPVLSALAGMISGGEEPTKWPSGEIYFTNLHISHDVAQAGFNVRSTILTASQRDGFENLARYTSRFNIPFPHFIELINGNRVVKGGNYQRNSNLIFAFDHGIYYLYEAGDILLDARGFPPITWLARFLEPLGIMSGLSSRGAYAVRYVVNDDYGPSVIFVESCIVGRTDGLLPQNCLTQAYIHAGVNAMVASTRVTADPGYLEPGLIFKGFGAKGFVDAWLRLMLKGEYPDLHFGGVISNEFINDLAKNDSTVGMALRDAKNKYLPEDANSTFLWTPPLNVAGLDNIYNKNTYTRGRFSYNNYLDKKYVCLHEFNLYGDPAFNPYQPINNG